MIYKREQLHPAFFIQKKERHRKALLEDIAGKLQLCNQTIGLMDVAREAEEAREDLFMALKGLGFRQFALSHLREGKSDKWYSDSSSVPYYFQLGRIKGNEYRGTYIQDHAMVVPIQCGKEVIGMFVGYHSFMTESNGFNYRLLMLLLEAYGRSVKTMGGLLH